MPSPLAPAQANRHRDHALLRRPLRGSDRAGARVLDRNSEVEPAPWAPQLEKGDRTVNGKDALLEFENVSKVYGSGETEVHALTDVSLTIAPGDFIAVRGPSGCGKSTLLHLAAALDEPTRGRVRYGETDLAALDATGRARLRRREHRRCVPEAQPRANPHRGRERHAPAGTRRCALPSRARPRARVGTHRGWPLDRCRPLSRRLLRWPAATHRDCTERSSASASSFSPTNRPERSIPRPATPSSSCWLPFRRRAVRPLCWSPMSRVCGVGRPCHVTARRRSRRHHSRARAGARHRSVVVSAGPVAGRLARREFVRRPWRSLLAVILVAIPVGATCAAVTLLRTDNVNGVSAADTGRCRPGGV